MKNSPVPTIPVPGLKLKCVVAQGAFGEVWVAEDSAGQFRSVKIIFKHSYGSGAYEIFLKGTHLFHTRASGIHPNLLPILSIGINSTAGYFYTITEIADDTETGRRIDPATYSPRTLAGELRQHGRLPLNHCTDLGICLASALNCLHATGLIHQQVILNNVLYVNGIPLLASAEHVAEIGDVQAGGNAFIPLEEQGRPGADVFALGMLLYSASTGFFAAKFPELPEEVLHEADGEVFRKWNRLILKACDPIARRRYQTAGELLEDLILIRRLRA